MLGELVWVGMDLVPGELIPMVVASPIYRGLVLSPNIEREGSQQRPNLKGDN